MTENFGNSDCYLVGGAVRDELLGLKPTEQDWVVVGRSPEQMKSLGFQAVGKDFPVFLHPETKQEYALARTERKTAPGHTGFEFHTSADVTLEQDLQRRDLTVNAIAKDKNSVLHDPFNGQQDINNRLLRHTSKAFAEDPLRVLRVARFKAQLSAFEFSIADSTMELMRQLVNNGEIHTLSPNRIWAETEKALLTAKPSLYFQTLRDCGALKILFPQVNALFGIPQRPEYHPEVDTGIHTLMVIDRAAELTDDLGVRFAALVHDLGKALTPESKWPRHVGHEKKGLIPLKQLTDHYPVPGKIKTIAQLCCEYHLLMHQFFELRPATILKLIEKLDGFRRPVHIEQFALLCQADSQGRGGHLRNQTYLQADLLRQIFQELKTISAKDISPTIPSGPDIAKAIKKLRTNKISALKQSYRLESIHANS